MSDLTKWPRLIVVGEKITEEQANDILLRTNWWHGHTNDRQWLATVAGLTGIPMSEYGWPEPDQFEREIDVLDLHHLTNERIASAWLGGPHGWCDWDGTIGCSNYNIGKWPSVEDITSDWEAIASAWPFLDLRCQVIPDEGEASAPAAEWRVQGGVVTEADPGEKLPPTELDMQMLAMQLHSPERERGVSFDRLRDALAQVRGSRG